MKRLSKIDDFKKLKVGQEVRLISKKGKQVQGEITMALTNRGYIDINEIEVYDYNLDYDITIDVDRYLEGTGSVKDFFMLSKGESLNEKPLYKALLELKDLKGVKDIYFHRNAQTGKIELNIEFNNELVDDELEILPIKEVKSCAIWE
ncbi:hypothetical protein [Clostridium disporicum]|uniref:hypothetical protein n=1 Tax=Clostridium disporicum TaxID=84024 RepID=UPI0034A186E1